MMHSEIKIISIALVFVVSTALSFSVNSGVTESKVAPGGNILNKDWCKSASIAVFGGTGKTGSECVFQALNAGSKVTVLARDPSKLRVPLGSGGKLGGTALFHSNLKVKRLYIPFLFFLSNLYNLI